MQENRSLTVLRAKNGLTKEEMATKLGMSRQAYSSIENGKIRGNIKFWGKVQKVFNIPSEEMWNLVNGNIEEHAKV